MTPLTNVEKTHAKNFVINMVKLFEELQNIENYEDLKQWLDSNEDKGKKDWFVNFEKIMDKVEKL